VQSAGKGEKNLVAALLKTSAPAGIFLVRKKVGGDPSNASLYQRLPNEVPRVRGSQHPSPGVAGTAGR